MIEFELTDWAAYAPGIEIREQWLAWANMPHLPVGEQMPTLAELPPMMRRRIDRLGRMAIQALLWCRAAEQAGVPVVFASRHGDVARSQQLLEQLAAGEPMSPAGFGLSVHNSIAALYSIACGERGNYTAIAAGRHCAEAAVCEAVAMLADGVDEVLLVVYDASIPAVHADFLDEPDPCYAWAWRIAAPGRGAPRFSLELLPSPGAVDVPVRAVEKPAAWLPHGLDVLRFALSGDVVLDDHASDRVADPSAGGGGWRWRRDG